MNEEKEKKQKKGNKATKDWRYVIWYFLIALMLVSIITTYMHEPKNATPIDFSSFVQEINKGSIQEVTIQSTDKSIIGKFKNGTTFKTYYIDYPELLPSIQNQGIKINVNPTDSGWFWGIFFQAILPFLLIGVIWFFIFKQASGATSQAFSFGKTKVMPWEKKDNKKSITFQDIAGVDEAVEELREIVDFLKAPKKYQTIGAKIPKGALLMGPPGTGKTLLAKAVAGEANVPFFKLSGSEFVEMFVGVGASRVRDLFAQAKKAQPCIIFVDELDAVGRHRGAGLGGGHDEREQTLNQLLVEMDGFESNQTVIVIAATNRPDILDPALLRPGRFDRQIVVDKPDIKGRTKILKIHSKNVSFEKEIELEIVAKRTPGFTGADLANLVNESALLAARKNQKKVKMSDLEEATDRVMAGPERKSKLISTKEKEIVAYHELGHAIVAATIPESDPVHKISILPRGLALGYTLQIPIEDKHLISKVEIESQIKVLMGGRIAEDLIFNQITSGASNDIEKATALAKNYICQYGMNTVLGTCKYGESKEYIFLGKEYSEGKQNYSESTAKKIDEEMKTLIQKCYQDAEKILTKYKNQMIELAKILIEKEVIEGNEFKERFNISGKTLNPAS